ncbi:MAG: tRNA (N6-threonylcarbamoyladenosine(37)-N6)-methyltransferase TrmO [Oscillospiraceae bacterium]|nr:tRNA (N6-threonylcarbamoyladenosine(37)-N6)-methyltransferase TrmO [Oscillospiraceae bacterium]
MEETTQMKIIARVHSEFPGKFGIPRQSGLVEGLKSTLVFEPSFRNPDTLRGMEGFSHLWLIWGFHEAKRENWSATVRPPRLGGNERLGVFATRSPFRPNPIGLSCVKLEEVEWDTPKGPVLHLSGADLMDGTPIYDIKPYIPYADCRPEATEGYAVRPRGLQVIIPLDCLEKVSPEKREALIGVLSCDPRPHYQNDPERIYGMSFAGLEVKFTVDGEVLTVVAVEGTQ